MHMLLYIIGGFMMVLGHVAATVVRTDDREPPGAGGE